jgi:predicted amino acid-binding ACT domain protein
MPDVTIVLSSFPVKICTIPCSIFQGLLSFFSSISQDKNTFLVVKLGFITEDEKVDILIKILKIGRIIVV